jgi:hypothetical protein
MLRTQNAASAAPTPRRSGTAIYGRAAPSQHLLLPKTEIITVVEMTTYFPNSLRNYDILLRFVQHGLDQQTIANIVNLHRTWEKMPALANSICKAVEKPFIDEGKKDWCVGNHEKGLYKYDRDWLDDELTLSGTSLNCEKKLRYDDDGKLLNPPIGGIAMAHLANSVTVHPSYLTGDGFMLTRCIQYAAAHPEKGYIFPRDYDYLMEKLYDGRFLTSAHYDKPSIERFKTKQSWATNELPHVETFEGVNLSGDEETEDNSAQMPTPDAHQQSQPSFLMLEAASYAPRRINNKLFHRFQSAAVPQTGHVQRSHQALGFAGFPTIFRQLSNEPLSMTSYPSDEWELPGMSPGASHNLLGWNTGTAATPWWPAQESMSFYDKSACLDLSVFDGSMFDHTT